MGNEFYKIKLGPLMALPSKTIDCDANATYAPSEATREFLAKLISDDQALGNPSAMHQFGQRAKVRIEESREVLRRFIKADLHDQIIFNSGASEGNNTIFSQLVTPTDHLVTTTVEHPCVLGAVEKLESVGAKVTRVAVSNDGRLNPSDILSVITDETKLVSVMLANNETGVIYPVAKLSKLIKERFPSVLIHTDASQALGKIPLDFTSLNVDLMTLSGHKVGALSGTGAVVAQANVVLTQFVVGGSQEGKLRGGTENVLGICSFGSALSELEHDFEERALIMRTARDTFEQEVTNKISSVFVNGSLENRLPNTSNLHFLGVRAADLVVALDLAGVLTSTGAACSSGKRDPSHVLLAMGKTVQEAQESVRFSFRGDISDDEIRSVIKIVIDKVSVIRSKYK